MFVTAHHARLGTRLQAKLCRGRHLRRLNSMSFQGATLRGSGRAVLPHPALASGDNAKEAVQRIRMIDAQRGQPAVNQSPHAVLAPQQLPAERRGFRGAIRPERLRGVSRPRALHQVEAGAAHHRVTGAGVSRGTAHPLGRGSKPKSSKANMLRAQASRAHMNKPSGVADCGAAVISGQPRRASSMF
jgi:hypothetical protein